MKHDSFTYIYYKIVTKVGSANHFFKKHLSWSWWIKGGAVIFPLENRKKL